VSGILLEGFAAAGRLQTSLAIGQHPKWSGRDDI
jgi:hypothetical protein